MPLWAIILLVVAGSLAVIVLGYQGSMVFVRIEEALQRWADRQGCRIIRRESRGFWQGPFSAPPSFPNGYRVVYYVSVEDREGRRRTAWVRLGWWWMLGFTEKIEVVWET